MTLQILSRLEIIGTSAFRRSRRGDGYCDGRFVATAAYERARATVILKNCIRVPYKERVRESSRSVAVNAILKKIACKQKRPPYIHSHTAMLRTTEHIESQTTRYSVTVAIYPCASEQGSSPKFGMLPRNLDWRSAGP
jgi:hypothetical protein